mgnify:CR=1 FL=1
MRPGALQNPTALIFAAGSGTRLGGEVPKQYLPLAGRAVLRHSIETFLRHPAISDIRVVISAEHRALYDGAVAGLAILPPVAPSTDENKAGILSHNAISGLTVASAVSNPLDTLI